MKARASTVLPRDSVLLGVLLQEPDTIGIDEMEAKLSTWLAVGRTEKRKD